MSLENIFHKISHFNYNNKAIVIVASITVTLICGVGLLNIRLETDPQNLWVSPGSVGYQQ